MILFRTAKKHLEEQATAELDVGAGGPSNSFEDAKAKVLEDLECIIDMDYLASNRGEYWKFRPIFMGFAKTPDCRGTGDIATYFVHKETGEVVSGCSEQDIEL